MQLGAVCIAFLLVIETGGIKLCSMDISFTTLSFKISMKVGNPPQTQTCVIDQAKDYSSFDSHQYKKDYSHSTNYIRHTEDGQLIDDTFKFMNSEVHFYHFYFRIVSDPQPNLNGLPLNSNRFGFGYKFKDKRLSIIHHLRDNQSIERLAYSFVFQNYSNIKLFLGGIPDEVSRSKKKGKCVVDQSQSNWACKLNRIHIGEYSYANSFEMIFQAAVEYIYVPKDFMTYLINEVFEKEIESYECRSYFDLMIYCERSVTEKVGRIMFEIGENSYSFISSELFLYQDWQSSQLCFVYNPMMNDTWIFGTVFLKYFDSLFDLEASEITFFSNERILPLQRNNRIVYLCVASVMSIIGLALLFYAKCHLNTELTLY